MAKLIASLHAVSCCDPRCVPEHFFNLRPGEVVVHRNAGGNIRPAIRDIIILDTLVRLDEVIIVHHTDCGTLRFTDQQLRDALKARVDKTHWDEIDGMEFGESSDVIESVKENLNWFQASPLIRDGLKQRTQGFVYDIKTGRVAKVDGAGLLP
ncbi:carbonic anhydrase [Aspergillus ibericus CBS 121593]|uniref:Carbonic anhydrase n=1 Tax=Aspergillus ibericus CBS 121593 TaxID=1448316 RepID=A0A395HBU4_9EURO|nr:carbonic anhydrase [Aspergillus ibericus CBS 121593]RAL03684.1 carbonic anhydrase [Aspergillus ibericus CBS 121593]